LSRPPREPSVLVVAQRGDVQTGVGQRLLEQALAERGRLVVLHGLEEVADVGARLAGAHVLQPGRIGLGVGSR
jgi:hypothetical protein